MRRALCFGFLVLCVFGTRGVEAGDAFGSVEVEPRQPVDLSAEFDGLIEAFQVVQLSAPVDGLLETVHVDRGDRVEKGQVLATLESRVEKATLKLAKARAELVARLRSQKARFEYQVTRLEQDEELHSNGVLSQDELDVTRTETRVAEAAVLEAEENLRLAALEQERAEATLELRVIRSPIAGIVTDRYLSVGELVTRQYQSKILALAQIDPLRVEVILPSLLFGKVSDGMQALVKTVDVAEGRTAARVTIVDGVLDAASNTFRVALELPNPDHRIPAGLKCRVRFVADAETQGPPVGPTESN